MMLAFRLSELFTPERITDISKERGFRPDITEQFLMDYLIQQRVAEALESITRGGMCMPFYHTDGELQRLSVDVDLATKMSSGRVDSVVRLAGDLPNIIRVERYTPSRLAVLKNNLVTYNVRYRSCFGQERRVKVDFLYGLDLDYETRTVPAGTKIMGFEMPHQMRILARSALMADKIGTLAAGTIGLDASRSGEMAKQVFDVGVLLNGATVDDMVGFFAEFPHMLEVEKTIHGQPDLVARAVVDSIDTALSQMQTVTGEMRFSGVAKRGYEGFNSAYISSKIWYQKIDHHANILYIMVLNRLMGQVLEGKSGEEAAVQMHQILANANDVSNYQHVRDLYGPMVRKATGISERYLERMSARLSCLLCAYAALASYSG